MCFLTAPNLFRIMSPSRNSDSAVDAKGRWYCGLLPFTWSYRFDAGKLGPPQWSQNSCARQPAIMDLDLPGLVQGSAMVLDVSATELCNTVLMVSFIQQPPRQKTKTEKKKEGFARPPSCNWQRFASLLDPATHWDSAISIRNASQQSDLTGSIWHHGDFATRVVQCNAAQCTPVETQIHYNRARNPSLYNRRYRRKVTARQAAHARSLGPHVKSSSRPNCEIGEKATSPQGSPASYATCSNYFPSTRITIPFESTVNHHLRTRQRCKPPGAASTPML